MSDTPLTDGNAIDHLTQNGRPVVRIEFARDLELQLTVAQARIKELKLELAATKALLILARSLNHARRADSEIVEWLLANAVSIGVSDQSYHELTGFTYESLLDEARKEQP